MVERPTRPLARGPIRAAEPVVEVDGWEVSARRSRAALRLADQTPLAKVLVRAAPTGRVAARLGVGCGRASRDGHRTLVVGSGPGEWLLLSAAGTQREVVARLDTSDDRLVSVLDVTHGRALLRLSGPRAADVLSKVCAVDLSDEAVPDGSALRSTVAGLTTDIVRDHTFLDDAPLDGAAGTPSYLLHCERSTGQHLFDALLDAGREFGIDRDGFRPGSAP